MENVEGLNLRLILRAIELEAMYDPQISGFRLRFTPELLRAMVGEENYRYLAKREIGTEHVDREFGKVPFADDPEAYWGTYFGPDPEFPVQVAHHEETIGYTDRNRCVRLK